MMTRKCYLAPLTAVLLLSLAVVVACENVEQYIYSGQRYDDAGACLAQTEKIEAVNGIGASSRCAPTCFMVDDALYVSTLCGALPAIATIVPRETPECAAAIAALRADAQCEEPETGDADTDAPVIEQDGGADAEADTGSETSTPVDAGSDG